MASAQKASNLGVVLRTAGDLRVVSASNLVPPFVNRAPSRLGSTFFVYCTVPLSVLPLRICIPTSRPSFPVSFKWSRPIFLCQLYSLELISSFSESPCVQLWRVRICERDLQSRYFAALWCGLLLLQKLKKHGY